MADYANQKFKCARNVLMGGPIGTFDKGIVSNVWETCWRKSSYKSILGTPSP